MPVEQVKVVEVKGFGDAKTLEESHPAFANIELRRINGHASLYDSDFRHQAYIELAISTSKRKRSLSRFWQFSEEEITSVAMSEAQWATLVSSVGIGGGVPCTLMRREGKMVPQLPEPEAQAGMFAREASESLENAMAKLKEIQQEVSDLKLSAKARDSLQSKLNGVSNAIGTNLHFVAKQFGTYMEKTTEKAKAEIAAYFAGRHADAAKALGKTGMPIGIIESDRE